MRITGSLIRGLMFASFAASALAAVAGLGYFAKVESQVLATPNNIIVGDVLAGAIITIEFNVANATASKVQLVETFKHCDCTDVQCKRDALEPGETAQCSIAWKTGGRTGATNTLIGQTWRIVGTEQAWLCNVSSRCYVSAENPFAEASAILRGDERPTATVKLHPSLRCFRPNLMLTTSDPSLHATLDDGPEGLQVTVRALARAVQRDAMVVLAVRHGQTLIRYEMPVRFQPDG